MTADGIRTLASLRKWDPYPLYTMTYYGGYPGPGTRTQAPTAAASAQPVGSWACSLFAAFGGAADAVYGRNFDWDYSPALLVVTHPPGGYAAVAMVDLTYLGLSRRDVMALPSSERRAHLLRAPLLPFDGMNEYGLTVGMAAVPDAEEGPVDPRKPTVGSLGVMRLMLDHARTTAEAIALFRRYNIDFTGGPALHYLLADRTGHAATVEFRAGALRVVWAPGPWSVATNIFLAGATDSAEAQDWRYRTAMAWLQRARGRLAPREAMRLLAAVAQTITQWSIVYDMRRGDLHVALARAYGHVHTFRLALHR